MTWTATACPPASTVTITTNVVSTNTIDADCDGVPTGIDCDDNDASVTSTNINDADCDGVPTGHGLRRQ